MIIQFKIIFSFSILTGFIFIVNCIIVYKLLNTYKCKILLLFSNNIKDGCQIYK